MLTPLKKVDAPKRPVKERRRGARSAAVRQARAILPNGQVVGCRIMNVSDGGALLAFQTTFGLPDDFHLVDDNQRIGVTVVRRETGRLAVRFNGSLKAEKR
jgi:hypothetical protein